MNATVIATNLRKLRTEKKYTQDQVAQMLSVSPQSVSRWECGTTLPEVTLLPEVAKIFAVTVDDLFREECLAYANYAQRLLAVYEASGKFEDFLAARREFQKLLASGGYGRDDLRSYGILNQYLMLNSADEAMLHFNKVLEAPERDSVYYSTWRQKLSLMVQLGQWKKAVQKVQALLDADKHNPEHWAMMVHVYERSEQPEKAQEYLHKALLMFPDHAIFHIYAGDLYRAQGNYDAAFAHWERSLSLDDSFMDARYAMASCYEELGQYGKAYDAWQALASEMDRRGWVIEKDYPIKMAQKCKEMMHQK